MTSTNNRARLIAAGAFVVAAIAAPFAASVLADSGADEPVAQCLAWFGNKEDGHCLGVSNGNGINVGTPQIGLDQGGAAVSTGPLLPGRIYGGNSGF